MNIATYLQEELEFLPDFVKEAIDSSNYNICAVVEYEDHYTLQTESGANVEIVNKIECPQILIDELEDRYTAYLVLYDIKYRGLTLLRERYSHSTFCKDRKTIIAMYLELESFVDTINKYKRTYLRFDFGYLEEIDDFLENYRDAVYACLKLDYCYEYYNTH